MNIALNSLQTEGTIAGKHHETTLSAWPIHQTALINQIKTTRTTKDDKGPVVFTKRPQQAVSRRTVLSTHLTLVH